MRPRLAALVVPLVLLAGCGGAGVAHDVSVVPNPLQIGRAHGIHRIKHVVVIMQENRSFDSYFGTFPGADGLPARDGRFTTCADDPRTGACDYPYHDPEQVNGGAQHNADSAEADIDGGAMDGFVKTAEHPGGRACGLTAPVCESSAPPDVMGYHDAREIPNYWRWAHDFTLQDHMFEPTASWSLPAHLFMVSGWSAHCTRGGDPSSCVNDDELGGFKTAQITGGGGPDGPQATAPTLRPVTRCLVQPLHTPPGIRPGPTPAPHHRCSCAVSPSRSAGGEGPAERVRELCVDRPHVAPPPGRRELGLLHP